jgi:hypothetical protein
MLLECDLSLFLSSIKPTGKGLFTRVFNNPQDHSAAAPVKHLHHAPGSDLTA